MDNANTKDVLIFAGENIIFSIYNGAPFEGLNVLSYRKFAARVLTNKTCVEIHTLPPTSNAASFHSQRAYLQMKMWMDKDNLDPCEWGWKVANGKLVPKPKDKRPNLTKGTAKAYRPTVSSVSTKHQSSNKTQIYRKGFYKKILLMKNCIPDAQTSAAIMNPLTEQMHQQCSTPERFSSLSDNIQQDSNSPSIISLPSSPVYLARPLQDLWILKAT
ncbi:unnamed protein product [Mytilus coruscus]|uniref:Uncharacterized protein n=1 Tax=Mytilus coruscus TaxID=42192 RepID=A0A6J8D0T6_MYTCO|nr:unnamed protein product [Mytilus coruscus]